MIKSARKPSSDPVQEKLRLSKSTWNKEVSQFINDLIHYKKLMNGWPNKFHMEKSFIKDPIPSDPATIIGSLVGDFNELAQKGNEIVKQQLDYSKSRRKKQPQQLNLPLGEPTAPAAPDLSKQLSLPSVAEVDYNFISESSNPLTRFIARRRNMTGFGESEGARIKQFRMSMLSHCAEMYKDLEKLQVQVLGKTNEEIFNAARIFAKSESDWFFFTEGIKTYKLSMTKVPIDTGGPIATPSKKEEEKQKTEPPVVVPEAPEAPETPIINPEVVSESDPLKIIDKTIAEYISAIRLGKLKNYSNLEMVLLNYNLASPDQKVKAASDFINAWEKTKSSNPDLNSSEDQLQVVAQDFMKKWFRKLKHKGLSSDKTSIFRLDVSRLAELIRKDLDKIMDSLEKTLDLEVMEKKASEISVNMMTIRELMNILLSTLKGIGFDDPFADMFNSKRFQELTKNMNEKQKKELRNKIENKRMLQMTNLFNRNMGRGF